MDIKCLVCNKLIKNVTFDRKYCRGNDCRKTFNKIKKCYLNNTLDKLTIKEQTYFKKLLKDGDLTKNEEVYENPNYKFSGQII